MAFFKQLYGVLKHAKPGHCSGTVAANVFVTALFCTGAHHPASWRLHVWPAAVARGQSAREDGGETQELGQVGGFSKANQNR